MILIVETNKEGKIKISKEDLEKALNEAYEQGAKDERRILELSTPTPIISPNPISNPFTCEHTTAAPNTGNKITIQSK